MDANAPDRHTEVSSSRVAYPTIAQLAIAVASDRPSPDTNLEQFHMTADSLIRQAEALRDFLSGKKVLFLGDDDHLSIVLAAFSDISPIVYELDPRVVASLKSWAAAIPIGNIEVLHYDIRQPLPNSDLCDAFCINPPYSSRTGGYGIRFWLTRALEGCTPLCDGVVVLPSDDTLSWVNRNWFSVQEFVAANGCRILNRERVTHLYEHTNDLGLRSENLYLRRYDPGRCLKEEPRAGESLYR